MANEHNTISWGASVMELTNGSKQPIKAGTTTTDVSGRLVADTIYYLYWKASDPTVWHTQLASVWDTNPSSGKVRVATITGAATGGKVQVKMVPSSAVSGQDRLNANQTVNQDSVSGTEIGTVGSVATTGVRVKFATSGTGASGSGSAGNFLRGYSTNSVSDTTGTWLDIDGDDESISIKSGVETSLLLSKFDATGIHFYNGSANNYILSGFNASGMKFYSGTASSISDGTTRAHYSGSALTFYNASGIGDGNELVSLGVGSAQGLNLFGSAASLTNPSLIRYQARVGGSWATRGYQGLYNDGSVDHLISYAPNTKVWHISDNVGNNTTVGSTIHFETISRPSADEAGWKMHSSSDSGDVFRNYFFPVNGGSGSNIAGDLTPDGTDDGHFNYIGYFDSDTRDSEGAITFGPQISQIQTYYISLGDGTAADPALVFDDGTGIYSPSDNAVGISAGDSLISTFDSSGLTMSTADNVILGDGGNVNISAPLLPTTDHTTSGLTAQMLAGGAIGAMDLVCIHSTTQEIVVADASAVATARTIGIAPAAISDEATGTVLLQGFIRDDTWDWTTGSPLYLSETAGDMTHTAPTTDGAFVQVVGVALEPDVVYFNPSMDIIEHA
tara:strand:- start:5121 stop:6971 length:1851 start_codon:yes stop_codon:yes gene_type:complete